MGERIRGRLGLTNGQSEPAYKRWYKTARWQRLRAQQLLDQPLCVMCKPRLVAATVCDHEHPHRGDEELFWSGPFQSLCASHHNSDKQRMEKGGKPKPTIGRDGWPE
jgi:5-methylcytosine-specific restriction protein A